MYQEFTKFEDNNNPDVVVYEKPTIPVNHESVESVFNKLGRFFFDDKWTGYEKLLKNKDLISLLCPNADIQPCLGIFSANLIEYEDPRNFYKELTNILKLNNKILESYFKNADIEEWKKKCIKIFGDKIFYKYILKISKNNKDSHKIINNISGFIIMFYTVKRYLEKAIRNQSLKTKIRYKKNGIEEEIPQQHLNSECDTAALLNIPGPLCVIHRYKSKDENYEALEPHEGTIYFCSSKIENFLSELKINEKNINVKNKNDIVKKYVERGYFSEQMLAFMEVSNELEMTLDNQPKAETVQKELEKRGFSKRLCTTGATIMRRHAVQKGGYTKILKK